MQEKAFGSIFPGVQCHACRSSYPREAGHFVLHERGAQVNGDVPNFTGIFEVIVEGLQTSKKKRVGEGNSCSPVIQVMILSAELIVVKDENSVQPQSATALRAENKLTQPELAELAGEISAMNIDRIAITWLGFSSSEVQTKRRSHQPEEQWHVVFDILETWQIKNQEPDEKRVSIQKFHSSLCLVSKFWTRSCL